MQESISFLYGLQMFGMKFGLRNIRTLLRSVGNPHRNYRTIHVAGTNGKGSTSSMIAAILTAAGYKVGLYTSPHLVAFNERIRINGVMISDDDISRYTRILRPAIVKCSATFFEATTAMAFKYFSDAKVDIAVIETGLGGRLDSTNVIRPLVSVITTIGMDHTEQLGTTFSAIAREKAGIIKPRVPVVIGAITGSALKTIRNRAVQLHSPFLHSRKIPIPSDIVLDLRGEYQRKNARCAIAAVTVASRHFLIGDKAVKEGLEHTTRLAGLRARFEIIQSRPRLLLDVAHNPDGIVHLVDELKTLKGKKTILFGVMKDKDYISMLRTLKKLRSPIILTQPQGTRALPSDELYTVSKRLGLNSFIANDVKHAFSMACMKTPSAGLVVVAGSHYLTGEVMKILEL